MAYIDPISGSLNPGELSEEARDILSRSEFIGGYVTRELKQALQKEAADNHRNLSQQLMHILSERYIKTP